MGAGVVTTSLNVKKNREYVCMPKCVIYHIPGTQKVQKGILEGIVPSKEQARFDGAYKTKRA